MGASRIRLVRVRGLVHLPRESYLIVVLGRIVSGRRVGLTGGDSFASSTPGRARAYWATCNAHDTRH